MSPFVIKVCALVLSIVYYSVRTYFERKMGLESKANQFTEMPARDQIELSMIAIGSVPLWVWMLSPLIDFAGYPLPMWARGAGAALAAASSAMLFWTHATLAGNWSPAVEVPRDGSLVTSGPYRLVRHPMYLSFLLYSVGFSLLSANWLVGAGAALAFCSLYFARVDREERVMVDTFGDAYCDYARHTGRLVPLIGRRRLAGAPLSKGA